MEIYRIQGDTAAYNAELYNMMVAHPGGREIAAELAVKYRTQYPRRSAMIDEVKRF